MPSLDRVAGDANSDQMALGSRPMLLRACRSSS
jgi:hypothetical protein